MEPRQGPRPARRLLHRRGLGVRMRQGPRGFDQEVRRAHLRRAHQELQEGRAQREVRPASARQDRPREGVQGVRRRRLRGRLLARVRVRLRRQPPRRRRVHRLRARHMRRDQGQGEDEARARGREHAHRRGEGRGVEARVGRQDVRRMALRQERMQGGALQGLGHQGRHAHDASGERNRGRQVVSASARGPEARRRR